ncbi:DUF1722 domain-containing protein [uncultured Klebsiella sp.]|uniref:DUF1722 domain-containing protein n=1 Tax=uncultured Klebsiella sp. TaxID=284011 RepID=UPI0035A742D3
MNETWLEDDDKTRMYTLRELDNLRREGLTRGGLIDFHSRYKLILLAHSQPAYRQIGPFVAAMADWPSLDAFFDAYRERLVNLLAHPSIRQNHTNVLMHVQGYFREHLTAEQKQALTMLINDYRLGREPLLAPVTLLKHYMTEFPDAYLAEQRYFTGWPETLNE